MRYYHLCVRWLVLLLSVASIHCASAQPLSPAARQTTALAPFSALRIVGDLDVEIVGGKRRHTLAIPQLQRPVYAKVSNHTLYLCANPECTRKEIGKFLGWPQAQRNSLVLVYMDDLSYLYYSGKGALTGINLKSDGLTLALENQGATVLEGMQLPLHHLYSHGSGDVKISSVATPSMDIELGGHSHVRLSGVSRLDHLSYHGEGRLYMNWLDSCRLQISGYGNAQAYLAGVVQDMHVVLTQHALLDARYLRAQDIAVNTRGSARADVWARGSLTALAGEQSNIYYYRLPDLLNDYQRGNGAVLPMMGLDLAVMRFPSAVHIPLVASARMA